MRTPRGYRPRLYKTKMCARFITKHPTDCMRGLSCAFAHTTDELKTPPDWATELHRAQRDTKNDRLGHRVKQLL